MSTHSFIDNTYRIFLLDVLNQIVIGENAHLVVIFGCEKLDVYSVLPTPSYLGFLFNVFAKRSVKITKPRVILLL
jgi:hypothetical protein